MNELKTVYLKDNELIKVNARTSDLRDPACLVWTGSNIELNVKCSELYMLMEGPYDMYECRIAIEINGSVISRFAISKEKQWVQIFRMMNPDIETNVRVIKEVQLMPQDEHHCLNVYAVKLDGDILPVKEKNLKIEFIGDSITSGEGTIGAKQDMDWISQYFAHTRSFPYFTGKELDADIRVFSQSGWGVYHSWDNNPTAALPLYYEETASLLNGEYFKNKGFKEKWDFKKWQPDYVIVNLGTNDDGAFHGMPYEDPVTGETYNLRMDGDKYNSDDLEKVRKAMTDFILKIRKNNPGACIIWAFGMLGHGMVPAIEKAIKECGDDNTYFIKLDDTTDETVGSRCHPGIKAHLNAAEKISNWILKNSK